MVCMRFFSSPSPWEMNLIFFYHITNLINSSAYHEAYTAAASAAAAAAGCGTCRRALTVDYNWATSAMSRLSHPIKRIVLAHG